MIEVESVNRSFTRRDGHKFQALKDVSLVVKDSEFLSIIGPSGCGKTTLLRMVGGLIKPDSGVIKIDGKAVRGPGPDRAIVFQQFLLLPWANVLANVSFGLEVRGVRRKQARQQAREVLERVGLADFEKNYPYELSGGMQQRVGLARALAVNPSYLLMDEPFASVDAQTRTVLQEDLLRIWQQERKTVLFVTHSMDEAVYLSDRVVVLRRSPGSVSEIIDIPLPRPRDDSVRRTALFGELSSHIWEQLRSSVEEDQKLERPVA
jgi:ABC-type nitrate/sulfonate/bicarbonate transport system ATPase subunit